MLRHSSTIHQPNLFGTDLHAVGCQYPLLQLADAIPWQEFDEACHYTKSTGAEAVGLLI
ncbi:MAG: hypothetical protein IPJ05_12485 [Nitrosomonas sp.]|nr:hypothetical protein [Nitrosomonas sp.]